MRVRELGSEELQETFPALDPRRIAGALALDGAPGSVALGREPFDSEIFGLEIGRILHLEAPSTPAFRVLLDGIAAAARARGLHQVLRRVPVSRLEEIWALEGAGFELMDVGVTFARRLRGRVVAPGYDDFEVRPSTDDDVAVIVPTMVDRPWGSRYESDPSYPPEKVRELRSRWLWNSHRGRAAIVLIGVIDGRPAGYVTCLLDAHERAGEIDLVGTLPEFRGRRVASRILEHAVAWYSERADLVTVRTQATNFAAANLYEKAGFVLHASDMTFRLALGAAKEKR